MTHSCDIAVIGAGMAGASLAAELAESASVILLEAENVPGYHATGRSAAFWTESYGGPGIQPLTAASEPWLRERGFLTSRGALTIARAGQEAALDAFAAGFYALGVAIEQIDHATMTGLVPGLRPEWTRGALEPSCCDIDVAALHQHCLARSRRAGAELLCSAQVTAIAAKGAGWSLTLADGREVIADIVVNAAGAWADPIASLADVRPLGVTPFRRTVAQVRIAPPVPDRLPLVLDLGEAFYFKPESGRLWLSPHDETPSPACDAAAEEIDVATAIDRLGGVVDWAVERVEHSWAGLRSFAPDRLPVYGMAADRPGFFWFVGQGGFGIQTAPAAARLAAGLLLTGRPAGEVDPAPYSPARFG